jgi:hypothetical protein
MGSVLGDRGLWLYAQPPINRLCVCRAGVHAGWLTCALAGPTLHTDPSSLSATRCANQPASRRKYTAAPPHPHGPLSLNRRSSTHHTRIPWPKRTRPRTMGQAHAPTVHGLWRGLCRLMGGCAYNHSPRSPNTEPTVHGPWRGLCRVFMRAHTHTLGSRSYSSTRRSLPSLSSSTSLRDMYTQRISQS